MVDETETATGLFSAPGQAPTRRTAVRGLLLVLAAPALSACGNGGFRPLYGSAAFGGADVATKLAQVEIAPIPGRVGQAIRNELIFETTGGGERQPPVYRLEIAIRESVASTLVQSNGNSFSSVYALDANFKLIRLADKKQMLSGQSFGRADFERFPQIFSNVRARNDAEDRAAKTVGTELKTRLAAFLSTQA
jgi:LPS-assembly lipoprotein